METEVLFKIGYRLLGDVENKIVEGWYYEPDISECIKSAERYLADFKKELYDAACLRAYYRIMQLHEQGKL